MKLDLAWAYGLPISAVIHAMKSGLRLCDRSHLMAAAIFFACIWVAGAADDSKTAQTWPSGQWIG